MLEAGVSAILGPAIFAAREFNQPYNRHCNHAASTVGVLHRIPAENALFHSEFALKATGRSS